MSPDHNSLEALIFDVDGTLADTEQDGHRPAFNQAFAEFGLNWRWDPPLYHELLAVAGGRERIRHYIDDHLPADAKPVPNGDIDTWIARLHTRKTEIFQVLLRDGAIPLNSGVGRVLRAAREQGVRLAIATTTGRGNFAALLESNLGPGALDWFDAIGAGDQVAKKKPAPDVYLWVLGRLGLRPRDCVVIEDSPIGLSAARAAGIGCTLICAGAHGDADAYPGASLVVDRLGEPMAPSRVLRGTLALTEGCVTLDTFRRLHALETNTR